MSRTLTAPTRLRSRFGKAASGGERESARAGDQQGQVVGLSSCAELLHTVQNGRNDFARRKVTCGAQFFDQPLFTEFLILAPFSFCYAVAKDHQNISIGELCLANRTFPALK